MLRLDLARLAREGSLLVEGRIPPEDALWGESGLRFSEPVAVRLRASLAGSGELVVRGTIAAPLRSECRRCLKPVAREVEEDVTMLFVASDTPGAEEDVDARLFDPGASELDLGVAVREELILTVDPYAVCRPDCKGLCPKCGTNLNHETCDCGEEEQDPRWDALRALRER